MPTNHDNIWAMSWDFQQCGVLTSVDSGEPVQPFLSFDSPNVVQSVTEHFKNIEATSKGSDQTARMRRLVWAFAGRTYHIVGNLTYYIKFYSSYEMYFTTKRKWIGAESYGWLSAFCVHSNQTYKLIVVFGIEGLLVRDSPPAAHRPGRFV